MDKLFCGDRKIIMHQLIGSILFLSALFISSNSFNEPEVLPKWYAFLIGSLACSCIFLCTQKKLSVSWNNSAGLLLGFILYILLWNSISYTGIVSLLSPLAFFVLFICFSNFPDQLKQTIPYIIIGACLLQAAYGILQYTGVFYSSGAFAVVGSFENPAGFSACLSAGFPFCFKLFQHTKKQCIAGIFSLLIILMAVALSGSRAGVFSLVITSLVFFAIRYSAKIKRKGVWLCGSLFLLLILGIALFFLKKDSALGRLLVWQNSITLMKDSPIWGHGPGGFSAHYMDYQARYFSVNPESPYSQLADNVSFPFNDYLLLGIEYGLAGILLVAALLFSIIKASRNVSLSHLCLLSVAVSACFSYPLRYPFVHLLLAYSLAMLVQKGGREIKFHTIARVLLASIALAGIVLLGRDMHFEIRWKRLVNLSMLGKNREILPEYASLYQEWNHNPLFLYNYGALLNRTGYYALSNRIMQECEKRVNDHDVQMILADNYYYQKEWILAEEKYLTAGRMCPNRFMPLYRLFSIYREKGETGRAKEIGSLILNKPVKIRSKIIEEIREEVFVFMNLEDNTPRKLPL